MLDQKFLVALLVAIGSVKLAACSGEAARSAQISPTQRSSMGTSSSKSANEPPFVARNTHVPHKDAPREAFLSTYNNPEEGISLRYPRNYSLEEGDLEEHSFFLKRQEDLDSEQPAATCGNALTQDIRAAHATSSCSRWRRKMRLTRTASRNRRIRARS